MPEPGAGPTRKHLDAVFIAAALVCVAALIAAFIAADGFDLISIDGDDAPFVAPQDGNSPRVDTTETTRRNPRTTTTGGAAENTDSSIDESTASSGSSGSAAPSTTTPPSTAPPPPPDPGPAIALIQGKFERCYVNAGIDPGTAFGVEYSAEPTGDPNMWTTTLIVPPLGGVVGTFTADLGAATLAPVDEKSGEWLIACPNFATPGG